MSDHTTTTCTTPKAMVWTGRVLSTLIILFMLLDGGMKVVKAQPVIEATVKLGYPESSIVPIGIAALAGATLYMIPQTAVLGAILLTGFLGGAVATQVRVQDPWYLFPIAFGIITWLGLYLRDARIRALLPLSIRCERTSTVTSIPIPAV